MKRITKIEENNALSVKTKTRVAAYCRVSTASDEQLISLDTQKAHYEDYIKSNSEWEYAGVFFDEGITGTKKECRDGLNSLIDSCEKGLVDLVITKSISRFSRNTTDCLKLVRKLIGLNVTVIFEKENINTMDSKGEVLLTIMASLAQQESESLSQNVKMGMQFRFQKGEVQVNHNRFMGYTKDEDGHLIIEPTEAEIVKRIYREYLQGASLKQIGDGLMKDGILTGAGKPKWRPESVKKILKNEKYIGDALLQKTYTVDVLTKKRVKNNGIVPQYYVENSHKPIIPRDLYMQVQEEMLRRSNLHSGVNRKKRVYSSKYALSSIVYCSKCGDIYRRIAWNNRGKHSTVWRCVNRVEHGPDCCDAPTVQEEELQNAVVKAINTALGGKDEMLTALEKNIAMVLALEDETSMESLDAKLEELQQELLKRANARQDYEDLADEIDLLREQKQNAMAENAEREGLKQRIAEMQQFLAGQTEQIEEYDENLVRRMVEKITVYEDKYAVEFKSGMEIDVKI